MSATLESSVVQDNDARGADPNATPNEAVRVWLRFGEHDVELGPGETIIGRSPKCQIVVDDPLVSRSHARLMVHRGIVTVEDLKSANGVLVNGERLMRTRVLTSGDRLLVGGQAFMLLAEAAEAQPSRRGRFAKTLAGRQFVDEATRTAEGEQEKSEATRRGDALELLASVADKVLALGRGDEAERVLSSYLRNLLQSARVGTDIDPAITERAATYAVRIAEATNKGSWVDYAIELYSIMKKPLPAVVIDRLYETLRKLAPLSAHVFRQYLVVLRSVEAQLGPSDRFLMRRIEGLDALGVFR
jgi:pSer/pThr/pTyr-binding forkhead associated (FHA) protein